MKSMNESDKCKVHEFYYEEPVEQWITIRRCKNCDYYEEIDWVNSRM
jgi:hypothetical protein